VPAASPRLHAHAMARARRGIRRVAVLFANLGTEDNETGGFRLWGPGHAPWLRRRAGCAGCTPRGPQGRVLLPQCLLCVGRLMSLWCQCRSENKRGGFRASFRGHAFPSVSSGIPSESACQLGPRAVPRAVSSKGGGSPHGCTGTRGRAKAHQSSARKRGAGRTAYTSSPHLKLSRAVTHRAWYGASPKNDRIRASSTASCSML